MTQVARALGLDVGERRIGVAVSDPLGVTAQPVEVWERRSLQEDLDHIAQLIAAWAAAAVVIGHPVTLAGGQSQQTRAVEAFAEAVRGHCAVPVHLCDERLTTVQGQRALLEGGVRRRERRAVIDQVAAQLLLQHYLDTHGGSA